MAGEGWRTGPVRRTTRFAASVLDPRLPARRLDVLDESNGAGPVFAIVDDDFRPRADVPATADDVTVWEVNFDQLAAMLGKALGFVASGAREAGGGCIQVGNVIARREETRPVFLHVPAGNLFDGEQLASVIAQLPASVLLLPSSRWITKEIAALAQTRGVRLDPVADRLKSPALERGTLHARARTAASAKGKGPILDVQPGWTWDKLKVGIDPVGKMHVSYGRHGATHDFRKASRSKAARHTEVLAMVAHYGEWTNPPSGDKDHETKRKAFQRLEKELRTLVPIAGKPFERVEGRWRPMFQLKLVGVDDMRGKRDDS